MGKAGRKPLNIYMCESVYSAIAVNLKKHKSTRQAILWFINESETFTALAEGRLHNEVMAGMERNTPDKLLDYQTIMHDPKLMKIKMEEMGYDYYEPETGEPFTKKDMDGMIEERDRIMLEVSRVADLSDRSETTSTGFSDRAYKQIWRMCESYEKYCIETNQTGPGPLPLNIVKNLPPHIIK
jgi:hypothetical protein